MKKIVLALGGNALGNTPSEQKEAVKKAAKAIVNLYEKKYKIIIVHGNGPQVGWINNSFSESFKNSRSKEPLPFPECGAMSQGYIGFHIQNAIQNEFLKRNIKGKVTTLITEAVVDKMDKAFKNPSKPIGEFMSESEAKKIALKNKWIVKEDSGRGWRRVIASPKPIDIPSLSIAQDLIEKNVITILGGGGGVPIIMEKSYIGVDAVIDKDLTASFVATNLKAEKLIILTAVDNVKINFGKKNEESLKKVNLIELEKHIKDNQFSPGSMLPKIYAAIDFVEKSNKSAFIGELHSALNIVEGLSGTEIIKD